MLGAVTGVMGTLQATEVLKEILGIGESLSGKLLIWDALATRFRTVRLRRTRTARCAARPRRSRTCRAAPRRGGRLPVPSEPLGILLLSGAHDRAHYAFVLASGAAALGREVVLFATNAGCHALLADWSGLAERARCARARRAASPGWTSCARRRANGGAPDRLRGRAARRGAGSGPLWQGVEVAGIATFLAEVGQAD